MFVIVACEGESDSLNAAALQADSGVATAMEESAAQLYDRYCGFCHGLEGEGYLSDNANALNHPQFLATATDDFLRIAIIEGRPGTPMSPWGRLNGGPLSDADVEKIVAYIRAWQTEPSRDVHAQAVEGQALRGQSAYNVHCAGCHGSEGEGVSAVSLNNPWFLASASDGYIKDAIVEGRLGTPMPAYGDTLRSQVINDMTALIRSWARPTDGSTVEAPEPELSEALLNPENPRAEFNLRDGRFVSAEQVKNALDNGESLVILDARATGDYVQSHIEGAVSLPFYQVTDYMEELPRDAFIVTYCGCPHAISGQAADALIEAGFENVGILDEGFYFWEDQGWPIASGL